MPAAPLAVRVWTSLPLTTTCQDDDVRVQLSQRLNAQTHPLHGPGRKVVKDDVRPLDQSPRDRHPGIRSEVNVDRATSRPDLGVLSATLTVGDVILEWANHPHRIESGRTFDMHDIGAEVREWFDRLWSDHEPTKVGNLHTSKRQIVCSN